MQSCEKYHEMISRMIDGELSDSELEDLRAHMDSCEDCRLVYNAFTGISEAISDDLVTPPESLAKGIMYKIDLQNSRGGKKRRFAFGRFTAIAACLALILFGATKLNFFGGSSSDTANTADAEASIQSFDTAAAPESANGDGSDGDAYFDYGVDQDDSATSSRDANEEAGEESEGMLTAAEEPAAEPPAPEQPANEGEYAGAASDEAAEYGVSLFGAVGAEIYSAGDERAEDEPLLTVTDEKTLLFLAELLAFGEDPDSGVPESEPVFSIGVEPESGKYYTVSVWVVDGRLWCCRDGTDMPYVALGSLEDLLEFIAEA